MAKKKKAVRWRRMVGGRGAVRRRREGEICRAILKWKISDLRRFCRSDLLTAEVVVVKLGLSDCLARLVLELGFDLPDSAKTELFVLIESLQKELWQEEKRLYYF